jgi:predicted Rossmann fold nucleotide-binding protein DprA/Smf involved in DNA uptake
MSTLAFTGPSSLFPRQVEAVTARLEKIVEPYDPWRSGCAYGVDTLAAYHALTAESLGIELYVPAAPHNEELVSELDGIARIIHCGGKDPYRRRNERMVKGADLLIAFVKGEKFYRSGEWMTVNIARKMGVEVDLNVIGWTK